MRRPLPSRLRQTCVGLCKDADTEGQADTSRTDGQTSSQPAVRIALCDIFHDGLGKLGSELPSLVMMGSPLLWNVLFSVL